MYSASCKSYTFAVVCHFQVQNHAVPLCQQWFGDWKRCIILSHHPLTVSFIVNDAFRSHHCHWACYRSPGRFVQSLARSCAHSPLELDSGWAHEAWLQPRRWLVQLLHQPLMVAQRFSRPSDGRIHNDHDNKQQKCWWASLFSRKATISWCKFSSPNYERIGGSWVRQHSSNVHQSNFRYSNRIGFW